MNFSGSSSVNPSRSFFKFLFAFFLWMVASTAVSAQDNRPHGTFSGVELTLSDAATSTGIPIGSTREFQETDRKVVLNFRNTTSQFRSLSYEVLTLDVEGLPTGFAVWRKQFINLQAGQRYTVTLNAEDGLTDLLP